MSKANEDTTQYHSQNSKKCLKRRNLWCLDNKVDPFTLIARVFELPDKIPRCHFWWKFGSLNNQQKNVGPFYISEIGFVIVGEIWEQYEDATSIQQPQRPS